MIQEITSSDHKLVKKVASLKEKKYRERYGEFLVEGAHSVNWALSSLYEVRDLVFSDDFLMPEDLKENLDGRNLVKVPGHVFAKMADTKTPQGILCTCALPKAMPPSSGGRYIYCDRVSDPGNLGSIIRSADALGFSGVMLSTCCVDPFNPKLVRSTMGSLFHVQLHMDVTPDKLAEMKVNGFQLIASALTNDSISLCDFAPEENLILVVGNEAKGVSEEIIQMADAVVKIPMAGSAESLNVAAAAAILMYEANAGRLA